MSRRRVVIRPRAAEDLREHAAHIALDSEEASRRFEEAAKLAFARLLEMPELGAPREYLDPRLPGLRMWRLQGFPSHLIFYRATDEGIELIRVLHAARDVPGVFAGE